MNATDITSLAKIALEKQVLPTLASDAFIAGFAQGYVKAKEDVSIKSLLSKEEAERKMILRFPKEIKLELLKAALEENEFDIFYKISLILLEAPLSEGGIASKEITAIHMDCLTRSTNGEGS
jgi:hypothetical protein